MKSTYTNLDELPLTLTANEAAAVLRISRSKIYTYLVCGAGNRGECWPTLNKASNKLGMG